MTQDYTALEAELRKRADSRASEHFPPRTFMEWKAADAIADLRRERDALLQVVRDADAIIAQHRTASQAEAAALRARLWPNPNFGPQSTAEIAIFVEEERKEIAALRARLAAVKGALRRLSSASGAFIRYFVPTDLPEDQSQQWQSVEQQIRNANAALQEPQAARRKP